LAVGAPKVSHTGRYVGIVAIVVVVAIIAAGFLVTVPVSSVATTPVAIVQTVETTFQTSTIIVTPISQSGSASATIWSESDESLKPNTYDSWYVSLTVGTDVELSWQASDSVNIYVFTSAQYSAYSTSGGSTTSPNVASASVASSSLTFTIAATDTYYLAIENPHNGLFGLGSTTVGYSSTGSETYPTTSTTYVTQTSTFLTSTPTVVTSTSTSTTTVTCSTPLWESFGSHTCS